MKTLKGIPDRLAVLTFDDGCKSDIEVVAPLLKTYGFGATFFVNDHTGAVSGWKSENYTTWAQIRRIHEMGFEIGNHTARHPGVCGLSDEALTIELEQIEQRCSENGISRPTTFCYPGFHFSAEAVRVLRSRGYQFARRGGFPEMPYHGEGARGPAYDPVVHDPLLVPTTGFSGPNWGMEDLKWAISGCHGGRSSAAMPAPNGQGHGGGTTAAMAPKVPAVAPEDGPHIAVLCFHGVPDVEHAWVHTDPGVFKTYMDYLRDSGCTVIAMRGLGDYVDPSAAVADPYAKMERVTQ